MQIAVTTKVGRVGSQAVNIGFSRARLQIPGHEFQALVPEAATNIKELSLSPATDTGRCETTRKSLGSSETGDQKPAIIFENTQRS
jgi:hypothetical protein